MPPFLKKKSVSNEWFIGGGRVHLSNMGSDTFLRKSTDTFSASLHFHFLKTLEHRTDLSVMSIFYDWIHEKGMGLTIPVWFYRFCSSKSGPLKPSFSLVTLFLHVFIFTEITHISWLLLILFSTFCIMVQENGLGH